MIYVTGHELNIRLSSVLCNEFACPGEVIQNNMNDQAERDSLKVFFHVPMFFLHAHVQKNPVYHIF